MLEQARANAIIAHESSLSQLQQVQQECSYGSSFNVDYQIGNTTIPLESFANLMIVPPVNSDLANFQEAGNPFCFLSCRKPISQMPTCVVVDTGCTRAMGSRNAIMRFLEAAGNRVKWRERP